MSSSSFHDADGGGGGEDDGFRNLATIDDIVKAHVKDAALSAKDLLRPTDQTIEFWRYMKTVLRSMSYPLDLYEGVPSDVHIDKCGTNTHVCCSIWTLSEKKYLLGMLPSFEDSKIPIGLIPDAKSSGIILKYLTIGLRLRAISDEKFCNIDYTQSYDRRSLNIIEGRLYPHNDCYRTERVIERSMCLNGLQRCATCFRPSLNQTVGEPIDPPTDRMETLAIRKLIAYNLTCCNTFICGACVRNTAHIFIRSRVRLFAPDHRAADELEEGPPSICPNHIPENFLLPTCPVCSTSSYDLYRDTDFRVLFLTSLFEMVDTSTLYAAQTIARVMLNQLIRIDGVSRVMIKQLSHTEGLSTMLEKYNSCFSQCLKVANTNRMDTCSSYHNH